MAPQSFRGTTTGRSAVRNRLYREGRTTPPPVHPMMKNLTPRSPPPQMVPAPRESGDAPSPQADRPGAIQFSHRESDSVYSLFPHRGNYHIIFPVRFVDIHGVITCPCRSSVMNRELRNSTSECFTMSIFSPTPNRFSTKFTYLSHLDGTIENCFVSETPWIGGELVDSYGTSRRPRESRLSFTALLRKRWKNK